MKKFYALLLFVFISNFSLHAQDDPDLLGTWYLHFIETNGSTLFPPSGSSLPMVFLSSTASEPITGNSTCNTFSSGYVISNNNASIDIINFVQTLVMCGGDTFEPVHLGILGNDATNFFDYTINTQEETLTMIDLLGEKLVYGRQILATSDNEAFSKSIALYPNPAQKELFFTGISTNTNTSYSIYNLVGNVVIDERSMMQNSLDVSTLKAGIYFVKIKQQGKTAVKKFIKMQNG